MNLITYADKVALNENPQIADINKVTASDMNQIKNAINNLFPVGFIISVDNAEFNPNTSWGGTWERLKGRVIVGVNEDDSDFATSGKTGGEKEVTLGNEHIPEHSHTVLGYAGNSTWSSGEIWFRAAADGGNLPKSKTTSSAGGGQPHNNMPPYYTAYQWIKTAM